MAWHYINLLGASWAVCSLWVAELDATSMCPDGIFEVNPYGAADIEVQPVRVAPGMRDAAP